MIHPYNHIACSNDALQVVLKVNWIVLTHNKAFIKSPSTLLDCKVGGFILVI